ncbi:unnamed protein product [Larinioides sclopetarius]|uniref:Uncharacterized protein n=1 Tax=Larinioides sclopetarius TaxID=280406 RepID=A0AAV2BER3_9ARAC
MTDGSINNHLSKAITLFLEEAKVCEDYFSIRFHPGSTNEQSTITSVLPMNVVL